MSTALITLLYSMAFWFLVASVDRIHQPLEALAKFVIQKLKKHL